MKRFLALIPLFFCLLCYAQDEEGCNCFGILVGKDASTDGSVILGHNEDDDPGLMLNAYITKNYFWAEVPGMETADAFMNKWGVGIVSDNCKSREDRDDFTEGGVLYQIRVNVAKRAHTAREGVSIIAELVEKYGYRDSGRSYLIADRDEIWMVSVVKGRHWVAQRVPDDAVVVIPNVYVIDKIDLSDKDNFAGSADIITYAQSRGWYDPEKDGEFSFRKVYASEATKTGKSNIERRRDALKVFGITSDDPLNEPFSFKPSAKVSINDMMNALSSHREKYVTGSLTRNSTIASTIFHFRRDLPLELGSICWFAMGHPDVEPYFPVYLGMDALPAGFGRFVTPVLAEMRHLTDTKDIRTKYPNVNWWKHLDRWNKIFSNTEKYEIKAWEKSTKLQQEIFNAQTDFEAKMMKKYFPETDVTLDKGRLAKELNEFFDKFYQKWYVNM